MFGPNTLTEFDSVDNYHHRSDEFRKLLTDIELEFVEKFGLQDYDILFLTGNGTFANEAVIYSLKYPLQVEYPDADFGLRLARTAAAHPKWGDRSRTVAVYTVYETSISRHNLEPVGELLFADMVSAFPYWLPSKSVDIFTTVSSKQLGALPVLGIVGIRKGLNILDPGVWSSLSLSTHLRFREQHETMTTPAIPLYVDLLRAVREFDRDSFIEKIDRRRRMVIDAVGLENVIGDGPVVTLRKCKATDIPGTYPAKTGSQVFLWSGTDMEYEEAFG
jgi:aspartate aminotransferase-like enzyme